MSEPVETKGKKFVAFLPKREYNVGAWRVECGVMVSPSAMNLKCNSVIPTLNSPLSTLNSQLLTPNSTLK